MRHLSKTIAIAIVCAATAVAAQQATDPDVIARQDSMKAIGASMKVLGDMAGAKTAFDATKAEEAKAALVAAATSLPVVFEKEVADPASKSKPEIWTNWDDFVKQAAVLQSAAEGLDATSLDGIKAGMGAAGGTCRACHTAYRM